MWFEFSQRNWMVLQISRESIPGSRCRKWKTSSTNVHSFTSRNKKLARSWQIGAGDVPQLHQPERNVLQDNLVPNPCKHLYAMTHSLYVIRCGKVSQCNCFFMRSVTLAWPLTRKKQDGSSCRFQNGLQSSGRLNWRTSKYAVTIIEAAVYHCTHQSVCRIDSQRTLHQS